MKVCIINLKGYSLFNNKTSFLFGGAEVQLYLIAKKFSEHTNVEVNIIVVDYGQELLEKFDKIKCWKSFKLKDNILKKIYIFFKVFKKIDSDVYLQRTLTIFTCFLIFYCKLKNKKFIYMVAHDNEVNGKHKLYKNKVIKKIILNSLKKLNGDIIVQSEYQKNKLKENNIKSIIIKSSYEIKTIFNNDKNYLLWVGRSKSWKKPQLFIELAKDLPHLNFIIICQEQDKVLQTEIKEVSKDIKNLEFIDFVSFDDIDKYFSKAKVLVNTSDFEGFPNTFLQAFNNKVPVISLNVNPDNVIDKYSLGFSLNGNINNLKNKAELLFRDEKLYQGISENCYTYMKKNHDINKNNQELLKLILA